MQQQLRRFLFLLFAALALGPPVCAQSTAKTFTFTSSSSPCATIGVTSQASVAITVTGTFSMTLQPEIAQQGQAAQNTQVTPTTSSTPQATITAVGGYQAAVGGWDTFLVCVTSYASGTAYVTLNASTAVNANLFGSGGGGGGVTSVTGTAHQIDSTGGTTPVVSFDPLAQIATGNSFAPLNAGQIAGSQTWLQSGIPAPAVAQSNGGSIGGNPAYVGITYKTAAGETMLGTVAYGSAITGSCTGGSCEYTITAPTLASGVTGYTAYECESGTSPSGTGIPPCTLKQVSGCVNITTNCVITTSGAGSNAPTVNTAWLEPPNVQSTLCPYSVIPSAFAPDNSGNYQTLWGIDPNSSNSRTIGTWEICYPTWFNDTKTTPVQGNNSFFVVDHAFGTNTSTANQDRSMWVGGATPSGDSASRYALAGIQSELDFNCNGCSITGSPDGEVSDLSVNTTETSATNYSSIALGTNVIRASLYKQGAGAGGSYSIVNGIFTSNNSTYPGGAKVAIYRSSCTGAMGNAFCLGLYHTYDSSSATVQAALYTPTGQSPGGSNNYWLLNETAGIPSIINGVTTVAGINMNNVASMPVLASMNTTGSQTVTQSTITGPSGVICTGNPGSSTYGYEFIGVDGNGGTVASSQMSSSASCANPLTSGNPATINVSATALLSMQSFVRIDVYRTSGPMATGKIGSLTCSAVNGFSLSCNSFSDTGLSASGSAPTANTTGSDVAYKFGTTSPCSAVGTAASPSVVSCGAAASGIFFCDVAASGTTCQINTTAVTAASVISITSSAADGTALSKTCNTGSTVTVVPAVQLASKSAGVSFTLNMPTETVNGSCYEYTITD